MDAEQDACGDMDVGASCMDCSPQLASINQSSYRRTSVGVESSPMSPAPRLKRWDVSNLVKLFTEVIRMDKSLFLSQLHHELQWQLKPGDISDILSDYEGFIDKAVSESKSEAQACEELGSPKAIAQDIIVEAGRNPASKLTLSPRGKWKIVLSLSPIVFALFYVIFINAIEHNNILVSAIVGMVIFAGILWLLLRFGIDTLPQSRYQGNSKLKHLLIASHVVLFLSAVASHIIIITIISALSNSTDFSTISTFTFARTMIKFLAVLITAFSFYGFYKSTPYYFTVSCHAIAVLAYLATSANALMYIDTFEPLRNNLVLATVTYVVGIALTVLLGLFIRSLKKAGGH
jgi:hypothetical protein